MAKEAGSGPKGLTRRYEEITDQNMPFPQSAALSNKVNRENSVNHG